MKPEVDEALANTASLPTIAEHVQPVSSAATSVKSKMDFFVHLWGSAAEVQVNGTHVRRSPQ